MNSIYTNADPALLKLFEQAGSLQKVLCAPMDFAKKSHAVMFCNGAGDVLKKAFYVTNSPEGVEKLITELKATCRHRSIALQHVFLGGEDSPAFAENFVAKLRQRKFIVARVNAFAAKEQRENRQASTDALDLHGIAHCLLKGRARVLAEGQELHEQLRVLVRERQYVVGQLTALKNRLHPLVDRLFPGFLESKLSGIDPYGPACLWLLEQRFSAPQMARRNLDARIAGLRKHRVRAPEEKAQQLQAYAKTVLPPRPELIAVSQFGVRQLARLFLALQATATELKQNIAELLVRSPGARLTTIPGVALTLSAGLAAEIYLMKEIPPLGRLCCYAGIIPATAQSGGAEKKAVHHAPAPLCNSRLKDHLMRAGELMGNQPGTDAARLRQSAEESKQHTERVLAKHAAAVVRALLLNERAYLPAQLYDPQSAPEHRGAYFQAQWPRLCEKWRRFLPLNQVFDPTRPLGRWRQMAQEAYRISLPLPGSNEDRKDQPEEVLGQEDP